MGGGGVPYCFCPSSPIHLTLLACVGTVCLPLSYAEVEFSVLCFLFWLPFICLVCDIDPLLSFPVVQIHFLDVLAPPSLWFVLSMFSLPFQCNSSSPSPSQRSSSTLSFSGLFCRCLPCLSVIQLPIPGQGVQSVRSLPSSCPRYIFWAISVSRAVPSASSPS